MKVPGWLVAVLTPVVFFGGCTGSLLPVWQWLERKATHAVKESERHIVPLLAMKDGRYVVTGQSTAEGATLLTSISKADERKINRDLCDRLGMENYYAWFRVLEEKDGVTKIALEAPNLKNSKRMGWYSLNHGEVRLERVVYYGPGFAYGVMPWVFIAGLLSVAAYQVAANRLRKSGRVNLSRDLDAVVD